MARFFGRRPGPADAGPDSGTIPSSVRVAVITMVRDEAVLLPLWLGYYGAQVGIENLYVVDDNSVDGGTEGLECTVLRVPEVRGGRFESTRMRLLGGLADALLALYDAVLFVDADEFVVADPLRFDGLPAFVAEHRGASAVGVLGLNLIHHLGAEEPLDLSRPVLEQRRLAKFVPVMCKPSLNLSGARWVAASHGIRAPYDVSAHLWMFHLKFADRDLLEGAASRRREMVERDGRSSKTSWGKTGAEMVGLLEEIGAQVDQAPSIAEFVAPSEQALADLVVGEEKGVYRSPKGGQVDAMRRQPLVRVPERFAHLL
ncbi:MAG TPA: glycosyltransferase family 2 protein [Marmoricola sp.]|jgi:hypothetical protein|nr:glycosyltransferase family 2 protein [Marmoricola sp.]